MGSDGGRAEPQSQILAHGGDAGPNPGTWGTAKSMIQAYRTDQTYGLTPPAIWPTQPNVEHHWATAFVLGREGEGWKREHLNIMVSVHFSEISES